MWSLTSTSLVAAVCLLAVVSAEDNSTDPTNLEDVDAKPLPATDPMTDTYAIVNKSDDKVNCFYGEFAGQLAVTYTPGKDKEPQTGYINLNNATVIQKESMCNATEIALVAEIANKNGTLVMTFVNANKSYYVNEIQLTVKADDKHFPDYDNGTTIDLHFTNLTLFKSATSDSYSCSTETVKDDTGSAKLTFSKIKISAFRNKPVNDKSFPNLKDCKSTKIDDIVPIAVGVALFSLVVIVLIAYFIGRRRTRRLAYQSV